MSVSHRFKRIADGHYKAFVLWLILGLASPQFISNALAAEAQSNSFVGHMQLKIQSMRTQHSRTAAGVRLHNRAELVHVYDRTGYTAIWSQGPQWNRNTSAMLEYLNELPYHGLDPRNYHLGDLQTLLQHPTLANRIHADLLFSDALISLASDLEYGASSRFSQTGKARQVLLKIQPNSRPGQALNALLPQHKGYWALSNALKQRLRSDQPMVTRPLQGVRLIQPGQRHAEVAALRARLTNTGDYQNTPDSDPRLFEPALSAALATFQARNGLDNDGVLGPATRAALNRGRADEIDMISLNLERWRKADTDYADSYVRVNIAAQQLHYVHQGRKQLEMKVIVGRSDRPTPTTSSAIREVVFNPYWNVPTRIAVVDKLPKIRSNPDYLKQRGFIVRSSWANNASVLNPHEVDWDQINRNNFRFHLRQNPGPQNALGQVKFLFPNEYSVYLHDTPSKQLFARGQRLFSSGCIRLDQPMQLAQALLRNHSQTGEQRPAQAQAYGTNESVRLNKSVPVFLEYWTAWVDDKGTLQLRNDVYQRDTSVLAALQDQGAYRSATQLARLAPDQPLQMAANLH